MGLAAWVYHGFGETTSDSSQTTLSLYCACISFHLSALGKSALGDRARYERAQTAHDLEGQFVQSTSKKNLEMTSSLVARKKVRCAI